MGYDELQTHMFAESDIRKNVSSSKMNTPPPPNHTKIIFKFQELFDSWYL